jgi:hypothetical protein
MKTSFIAGYNEYFSCFHSKEFIEIGRFANLKRNISAAKGSKVRDLLGPNFDI